MNTPNHFMLIKSEIVNESDFEIKTTLCVLSTKKQYFI